MVVWVILVLLTKVPAAIEVTLVALFAYPVRFAVLFLVQLKVVPETPLGLEIAIAVKGVPPHKVWVADGVINTSGLAFTVTEMVLIVVLQPFADAVIVKTVTCCTLVLLVRFPEMVAPDPVSPTVPVKFTMLSRLQLYVVPATAFGLLIVILAMLFPEQIVCVIGVADTVGFGFTITCEVAASEIQPSSEVAYKEKVTVCGAFVLLVKFPEITCVLPLAAIPVTFTVLFRVQL